MTKIIKSRIDFLKQILQTGDLSTQEELVDKLQKSNYMVTQSTVSRDLRKLGAVRTVDNKGRTVYRLPEEIFIPVKSSSLKDMITSIDSNGALIVIKTHPGSASLLGRYIDMTFSEEILGCIAGDDTVFVAPNNLRNIQAVLKKIESSIHNN